MIIEQLIANIKSVGIFAVVLSILIVVHEWGHYITAKRAGIGVERFSLGFGPKLFSKVFNGTEFLLCLIPLGGYVKMMGDERSECTGDAKEFYSQPPGKRALVILNGPVVNFIFAYLCLVCVFLLGYPGGSTKITKIEINGPAHKAGLMVGDKIIEVDYYLPGCPPTAEWVGKAVDAIASGKLPPKGSVIGLEKILCDECPLERKNERSIKKFYRPHEIMPKPGQCLLEQGIICSGPATRAGCKARCIEVNMPCRGCYGPPPGVVDQGAKMLGAVASLVDADDESEIEAIVSRVKDPVGVFYQFSLAKSLLRSFRRGR